MTKLLGKLFGVLTGQLTATPVVLHASETCPDCGSMLARDSDNALNAAWHCPNPDCPPQVRARLELWCSPGAMDIKGCDAALVAQLVSQGLARDAAELYRLRPGELTGLDGMDSQAAGEFLAGIAASKSREAWRVLFGLGIPHIGEAEARVLCQSFPTLDDIFAAGRERLVKVAGVSEIAARHLTHWQGDPVNQKLVERLRKADVNFKSELYPTRAVPSPMKK